jgi:hypothetical protein
MSLILANIIGFITAHWRIIAPIAGFLVLLVVIIGFARSCGKKTVKIDEAQIQKINQANEKERKAELNKIITENSDVIKTVDERTELTEVNRVEREREIDARIKEADRKIQEVKEQKGNVTSEELECILMGNCK